MTSSQNILYISHGGGPLPLLGDVKHKELVDYLKKVSEQLPRPSVILVISAHWEEEIPTLTSGTDPALIYDYSGFPAESYEIQYPAPGEPELAKKILYVLRQHEIDAKLDKNRGFDHGMFVPLKIMYPEATIPCIQLSLTRDLDPERHLAIGQALRTLDHDGLLVIGSGFSFHNMRMFFTPETPETERQTKDFAHWLVKTCQDINLDEQERHRLLAQWDKAPGARFSHPREEHLLPLHVCYGMAGKPSDDAQIIHIMGKKAGMFHWAT